VFEWIQNAQERSRANIFTAGIPSGSPCTFGTALTSTGVTIHLYNPAGSGVNLTLFKATANVFTCTTTGDLVYCYNAQPSAPTGTTALTIQNERIGSVATPLAKCYSAATLAATPTELRPMVSAAASNSGDVISGFPDYLFGEIQVMPGYVLSIQGITIVGTGTLSYSWAETPVLNP
jgi:hypothetical protein